MVNDVSGLLCVVHSHLPGHGHSVEHSSDMSPVRFEPGAAAEGSLRVASQKAICFGSVPSAAELVRRTDIGILSLQVSLIVEKEIVGL